MTKTKEAWVEEAKAQKKQIFFFEDKVLDLTKFQSIHPGGKKALSNYVFKDITDTIFSVYPHAKEQTTKVLLSYVIGRIPLEETKKNTRRQRELTPPKDKKKVCFSKNGSGKKESTQIIGLIESNLTEDSWQDTPKMPKKVKKGKGQKQSSKKLIGSNKSIQSTKKIPQIKQIPSIKKIDDRLASLSLTDCSDIDFDEQKPVFKVPVLQTKNMSSIA